MMGRWELRITWFFFVANVACVAIPLLLREPPTWVNVGNAAVGLWMGHEVLNHYRSRGRARRMAQVFLSYQEALRVERGDAR